MSGNPFVEYLNRYTTVSPEHEAAFDEFITQTQPATGAPLRLETKIETFLVKDLFSKSRPPSVILTGNAGDGKTYLCRQIATQMNGSIPKDWDEQTSWAKETPGFKLVVVKDLSEIGETKGSELLDRLAKTYSQPTNDVFLIAANEGRLRALLSGNEELEKVREDVEAQLRNGPELDHQHLVVFNLNQITTSHFINKALGWLTAPENWQACQGCLAHKICPIQFNANKLSNDLIAARFQHLYQVLEHLDIHITIRDMLIHLAYSITGGNSCSKIIQQLDNKLIWIEKAHNYVYFENAWGEAADETFRRKAAAIRNLRKLNVGNSSIFAVDDFIVTGYPDDPVQQQTHRALFNESLDLGLKKFQQERLAYLQGGASSPKHDQVPVLMKWLPHCRRKLFFEWKEKETIERLYPFSYLSLYFKLLEGDQASLYNAKRDLVLGLNRSFSGLFLTNREDLYVTSQYAHAVEQPVPIVLISIPIDNIKLSFVSMQSPALDREMKKLMLTIYPPVKVDASPIEWHINLLRFEYLMRRSQGGTSNILAAECELSIRQLKDDLLSSFVQQEESNSSRIVFFAADRNRYKLQSMWVDENEHIRIGGGDL